jgi:hypothetical protein
MEDRTLNGVAVNIRAMDKELLNVEFWRNPALIASYAENILRYMNPEIDLRNVSVRFSKDSGAYCQWSDSTWEICLPEISINIKRTEEEIRKLIYARSMFLKHEISHAIFTKHGSNEDVHKFMNPIDDSRIEKLYGDIFKGARAGFRDLTKVFFNNIKHEIETDSISQNNFYFYARYRLAGYNFDESFEAIQFYKKLFEKHDINNFFIKDPDKYYDFVKNYFNNEVVPAFKKYQQEVIDAQVEEEIVEDAEDDEKFDSEDSEELVEKLISEVEEKSEKSEKNTSDDIEQDSNGDKTTEESNGDIDGVDNTSENIEDVDTETATESNDTTLDKDDDTEVDNTSSASSVDSAESKNVEKEDEETDVNVCISSTKKQKEWIDPNENNDFEEKEEKEEEEETEVDKLFKDQPIKDYKDLFVVTDEMTLPTADEFINNNFQLKDFNGATILSLKDYIENCNSGIGLNKDGEKIYSTVVQKHKKTILDTMQFLALKLQNRTRIHQHMHQLEGDLDQKNLIDILINKDMPRVFYRNTKINQIDNTLHLLVDVSSSMSAHDFQMAMSNAIVLFEICKRMKINVGIYLFSSFIGSIKARKDKPMNDAILKKIFPFHYKNFKVEKHYHRGTEKTTITYKFRIEGESDGTLFVIKSPQENFKPIHYKMLGSFWEHIPNKISCGTPEFQALVSLVKHYHVKGNNMMFLINDGGYNTDFANSIVVDDDSLRLYGSIRRIFYKNEEQFKQVLEHIIKDVESILNSQHLKTGLFARAIDYSSIKEGDIYFIDKILNAYIDTINKIINGAELVNDEYFTANNDKVAMIFNVNLMEKFHNTFEYAVFKELARIINIKYHKENVIYSSIVNRIRTDMKWKIFGIGIRSSIGKNYLGEDNFIFIKEAEDIEKLFSKKLKQIY